MKRAFSWQVFRMDDQQLLVGCHSPVALRQGPRSLYTRRLQWRSSKSAEGGGFNRLM